MIFKTFINNHYFTVSISSEFPIGFGLGSSAAYNVCIVNGIFNLIKSIIGKNFYSEDKIILLSNEGEKIFHNGTPSGIDASCSLYGGVILFRNINDQNKINISQKNFFFEKIKFLLIDTQIKRDGGDFINIVSNYKKNNLQEFNDAINNIEKVTNSIIKLITKEKSDENDCYEFFDLIKQNQKLLKEICVSNDEIDKIVNLLETNGFVGKISGAGGGGFIISFTLIEKISDLIKLLDENNIKYLNVNISKEPAKIIDMKYFSNN
jgi:mevalonate kinase